MSLDINLEGQDFKDVKIKTATEVLGTIYKRIRKKGLTVWNDYIASLVSDKKKAFLKFLYIKLGPNKS
jgi:hypothetical protein